MNPSFFWGGGFDRIEICPAKVGGWFFFPFFGTKACTAIAAVDTVFEEMAAKS